MVYSVSEKRNFRYGVRVVKCVTLLILLLAIQSHKRVSAEATRLDGVHSGGVWVFNAGTAREERGCETLPNTRQTNDNIVLAAQNAGIFELLGNDSADIENFVAGSGDEDTSADQIDRNTYEVIYGLASIDDYGVRTSPDDDNVNFDAGVGGEIAVGLHNPDRVIVADGIEATGGMKWLPIVPNSSTFDLDASLGGYEIFIFEDAALSGMTVELKSATNTYSFTVPDRLTIPDQETGSDDSLIAIDLDSLPGFDQTYIKAIRIVDNGKSMTADENCRNLGATSMEIDAIASRVKTVRSIVGSVASTVWLDQNKNGIQDANETGLRDVTLSLTGTSIEATEIALETTTDVDGQYRFADVLPGTYTVQIDPASLPPYLTQTHDADGIDSADSAALTLGMSEDNTQHNFGYHTAYPLEEAASPCSADTPAQSSTTIGDCVWYDMNRDGIQDVGEPGIGGATVSLYGSKGLVGTQVTNENGHYRFENVVSDMYTLTISFPVTYTDYIFSPINATFDNSDSDITRQQGQTPSFYALPDTHDVTHDIGIILPDTAIGSALWVDEDADGQQSVSEPGLPNITVYLLENGEIIATTTTDANGNYVFKMPLLAGAYSVEVDESTLPNGIQLNSVPVDSKQVSISASNNGTRSVRRTASAELNNITYGADNTVFGNFGYSYGDPNGNTGDGALGNRIWLDADANGIQGLGEMGIGGVLVTLAADNNGDGVIDITEQISTTVTTPDGVYLFPDLPTGIYKVFIDTTSANAVLANYVQTGDPDYYGRVPAINDNQTTRPVVIAPGDLFVNVDFGYKPAIINRIGDKIYLDANGNAQFDAGESGIPNVTVALLDTNGNFLATTQTDALGSYFFPGVYDGVFEVRVTDAVNVLGTLVQSADPDTVLDNRAITQVSGGITALAMDFGYTPYGQTTNSGLIGTQLFFDRNGSNSFDAGEGMEGIVLQLLGTNGNIIQTTTTSENGTYFFGRVAPGTYTVTVAAGYISAGIVNSVDADGTPDNVTVVTVGGAQGLIRDDINFGYIADRANAIGRISGEVWEDFNANAILDETSSKFENISIDLHLDSNGNGIIDLQDFIFSSTTTDADGQFIFDNLPANNVNYLVRITDVNQELIGYWHTETGMPGTDGHSQKTPYSITLTPDKTRDSSADFGYYVRLAAIGNRIWLDTNKNGVQDSNDLSGFANTTIKLKVEYLNGETILLAESGASGEYAFRNLLADEDFNGTGVVAPKYTLSVDFAEPNSLTVVDSTPNELLDSDNHLGEPAFPIQGESSVILLDDPGQEAPEAAYDFGFVSDPNAVSFRQPATSEATSRLPLILVAFVLISGLLTVTLFKKPHSQNPL